MKYCKDLLSYARRTTVPVRVGDVVIAGDSPIVVQSMTTTRTEDTTESVDQVIRIAREGAELVRLTAQGRSQAANLENISRELRLRDCLVPLVADIHFNPEAAFIAARYVQKVRINPGNFATQDQMSAKFAELLAVCREHGTALRVGVNHGSLSNRIMDQYGDTPRGMVESAMEYLRMARDEDFWNIVVSFKSSNVRVMVEAYRLGAAMMDAEGLCFPLHLGVTEAGEGEDGRVKSAVGIGALLCDGLGDTLRVSLTEEPEREIPVARILADYFRDRALQNYIPVDDEPLPYDPFEFRRRTTDILPEVVDRSLELCTAEEALAGTVQQYDAVAVRLEDLGYEFLEWLEGHDDVVLVLTSENNNWVAEIRAAFIQVMRHGLSNRIIIRRNYTEADPEALQIYAAADFGAVLIDGLGDGVWIENFGQTLEPGLGLSILQATRLRISRTEIISCPGCGRTLFDLPTTARAVKARFGNMPGLKIAVMGCIVNGPGEMADADYGYVGAGADLVTLYRGREVVERNVPQAEALERLEKLIEESYTKE